MSQKRVVFIAGPTSSGKTALALACAKRWDGEIVNADARQLFADAPVGTGIPHGDWIETDGERTYVVEGVPHHLMAVSGPDEAWTVSSWIEKANVALEGIWSRGKLPVVVGGTGLYIRALSEGFVFAGEPDQALRNELLALSSETRLEELLSRFPEAGKSIDLKNPHRVLRALEKLRSGTSIQPTVVPPGFEAIKVAIAREPDDLKRRLRETVTVQFSCGWVEEVKSLLEKGVSAETPLMQSIGFRTIARGIADSLSEDVMKELVIRETWQYVRRQLTWLRKEPSLLWAKDEAEAMALVERKFA